jgi:hypothetical protein
VEDDNAQLVRLHTDELTWRQVGDEVLILDAASSQYLSVNQTGSALWPLLLQGCRRADLSQSLVTRFGVDEGTAAADAEKFLSSLRELGLLDEDPAP